MVLSKAEQHADCGVNEVNHRLTVSRLLGRAKDFPPGIVTSWFGRLTPTRRAALKDGLGAGGGQETGQPWDGCSRWYPGHLPLGMHRCPRGQ